MKKPDNSIFGRLGKIGLVIAGIVLSWHFISQFGNDAGIDTTKESLLTLLIICCGIAFLCYLPLMAKGIKQTYHRRFSK